VLILRPNLGKGESGSRADEAKNASLARITYRKKRGIFSPLTCRLLVVNVVALAILLAGILYLPRYENSLIANQVQDLRTLGEVFSLALAEGAYETRTNGSTVLRSESASTMLNLLVGPTKDRTRLFDTNGYLVADSHSLSGPLGTSVIVSKMPPPDTVDLFGDFIKWLNKTFLNWLPGRDLPLYKEHSFQRASDYTEVERALEGELGYEIRRNEAGRLVISVATPVKRFQQVIGAVYIARDSVSIDETVRDFRIYILAIFAVALCVTVLLSFYLSSTIVRPLRHLAIAADRVRVAPGQVRSLPRFQSRNDEIGDLAEDLNAMTDALAQRLDAIESFAADVSHELKNPLTSLRSAVETAARLEDTEQQKKLMEIITDDVKRLDRLITDISDASRLDAELSRDESKNFDLGPLLRALVDVHATSGGYGERRIECEQNGSGPFTITGNEGRIVQVLQNLITNSFSFSPPDGQVTVKIRRDRDWIIISVEDEGPGIPQGSLEKIFDRFYSERPETEQFGIHSGLGLSISRQIITAHQGFLGAENLKNRDGTIKGACFVVRLPAS